MDYLIRLANKNDCKELSKLKHQVWQETYRGIYSDQKIDNFDYQTNEKRFLDIINNKGITLYIVESGNKIVGYMSCGTPLRPYKNYKQDIGLLYLLQEYQGKGIGKKLFNIACDSIRKNGYKQFFISCNKYNTPAQAFYKKMGGVVDYVDDDNIDGSLPQVKFIYQIKEGDSDEFECVEAIENK